MSVAYARDRIRSIVETKIARCAIGGFEVEYDVAPVMAAEPETGQMVVAYCLIMSCRSPLLRPPRIAITDLIYDGCPSKEQLEASVERDLDALFDIRRKLMQAHTAAGN